ncbi:MAG: hypothetical protein A4E30_01649 [Methanomassiliicoccales archaeon PtaB.Bin215]|nr:MAG: hypothetical protein A4E30_01649 [Methanomassiliicoccales archaeon PtaB.Bin215]
MKATVPPSPCTNSSAMQSPGEYGFSSNPATMHAWVYKMKGSSLSSC